MIWRDEEPLIHDPSHGSPCAGILAAVVLSVAMGYLLFAALLSHDRALIWLVVGWLSASAGVLWAVNGIGGETQP